LEHFRQSARGLLTDDVLDTLISELDTEKSQIERMLEDHKNRDKKVRELERAKDKAIQLIRSGSWERLGITAPDKRKDRYYEIGLRVKASKDRVYISWNVGQAEIDL
jgi:hypothetical protein